MCRPYSLKDDFQEKSEQGLRTETLNMSDDRLYLFALQTFMTSSPP
jgi:hypothetical protein